MTTIGTPPGVLDLTKVEWQIIRFYLNHETLRHMVNMDKLARQIGYPDAETAAADLNAKLKKRRKEEKKKASGKGSPFQIPAVKKEDLKGAFWTHENRWKKRKLQNKMARDEGASPRKLSSEKKLNTAKALPHENRVKKRKHHNKEARDEGGHSPKPSLEKQIARGDESDDEPVRESMEMKNPKAATAAATTHEKRAEKKKRRHKKARNGGTPSGNRFVGKQVAKRDEVYAEPVRKSPKMKHLGNDATATASTHDNRVKKKKKARDEGASSQKESLEEQVAESDGVDAEPAHQSMELKHPGKDATAAASPHEKRAKKKKREHHSKTTRDERASSQEEAFGKRALKANEVDAEPAHQPMEMKNIPTAAASVDANRVKKKHRSKNTSGESASFQSPFLERLSLTKPLPPMPSLPSPSLPSPSLPSPSLPSPSLPTPTRHKPSPEDQVMKGGKAGSPACEPMTSKPRAKIIKKEDPGVSALVEKIRGEKGKGKAIKQEDPEVDAIIEKTREERRKAAAAMDSESSDSDAVIFVRSVTKPRDSEYVAPKKRGTPANKNMDGGGGNRNTNAAGSNSTSATGNKSMNGAAKKANKPVTMGAEASIVPIIIDSDSDSDAPKKRNKSSKKKDHGASKNKKGKRAAETDESEGAIECITVYDSDSEPEARPKKRGRPAKKSPEGSSKRSRSIGRSSGPRKKARI